MPRVPWDTREDWLRFYKVMDPITGQFITYGEDRTWSPDKPENEVNHRADVLIARGITSAHRVLICGCGPGGFLIEAMKLRGIPNVWGVDSSPWVEERKGIADGDVVWLNEDFTGNIGNALRTMTGGRNFDWVITESVLESHTDQEIVVGLNACEGLRTPQTSMTRIIHIVFPPPFNEPGVFNEKTMSQWKAMRPTHTWLNAEGLQEA